MAGNQNVRIALDKVGNELDEALAQEIVRQGHNLTGKLIESIDHKVNEVIGSLELVGEFEHYGQFVDRGVKAQDIPFSPGSGNRRSKYITGLINWAKIKFSVDVKRARGIAFAIAHTHLRTGMPTRGKDFTGFLTKTLERKQDRITDILDKANADDIEFAIINIVRNNTVKL